jgi:haloalkane dehalogenase
VLCGVQIALQILYRSVNGIGGLAFTNPRRLTDAAINCHLGCLIAMSERKTQINAYAAALSPNPLQGIETELRRYNTPTRIVWGLGGRDTPA